MCYFYAGREELYARTKEVANNNNKEEPLASDKLTPLSVHHALETKSYTFTDRVIRISLQEAVHSKEDCYVFVYC